MKKILLALFILTVSAKAQGQSAESFPVITFDTTTYYFDTMMEGDTLNVKYHFINTGKTPLLIKQVWPGCGCTIPSFTKDPVLPGQGGFVELTFYSNTHPGDADKYAIILSNAAERHLFIKGFVVDKDHITRPTTYSKVVATAVVNVNGE